MLHEEDVQKKTGTKSGLFVWVFPSSAIGGKESASRA